MISEKPINAKHSYKISVSNFILNLNLYTDNKKIITKITVN